MVAVRLPQHRQLRSSYIPLQFRYRYILAPFLAVLGVVWEHFQRTTLLEKKIKKESKFKLQFQKVKFKPSGFLQKSPPLIFSNQNPDVKLYMCNSRRVGLYFFKKNWTSFETSANATTFFFPFFLLKNWCMSRRRFARALYSAHKKYPAPILDTESYSKLSTG